jgi:hypothetical protein
MAPLTDGTSGMGAAFARQHSVKALSRCTNPAGSKSTALALRWMKQAPQRGDRDDRSGRIAVVRASAGLTSPFHGIRDALPPAVSDAILRITFQTTRSGDRQNRCRWHCCGRAAHLEASLRRRGPAELCSQAKGTAQQKALWKQGDNAANDCSSWVDDTTTADVIVALGPSVVAVLALSSAAWQHTGVGQRSRMSHEPLPVASAPIA